MTKYLKAFSTFFLGLCILLSSIIISKSIEYQSINNIPYEYQQTKTLQSRYELITLSSDYFIMLDTYTGEYWMQVGNNEWEKHSSPH